MKKIILLILMGVGTSFIAQQTCGLDSYQREIETKEPSSKTRREAFDKEIGKIISNLRQSGKLSANTSKNQTQFYEIPVVVHVIESTSTANATLAVTDQEIINWINDTNKIFASLHPAYYPEGTGLGFNTVIPIKLVLAMRTPQCTASTGIYRYNGSVLPGYDQYGVKSNGSNGVTTDQIKALAPHWDEKSYFNIYIPIKFDGDATSFGLMGWAGYPTNPDSGYDSFMKAPVVKANSANTLAHEMMHAFNIDHTFGNADVAGVNCSTSTGNCNVDDDKTCDTERTKCLLNTANLPTNSQINPCTGVNWQDGQFNIMQYTNTSKKFTPGQRDRAIASMISLRPSLFTSLGGTALNLNPNTTSLPIAASCTPTGNAIIGAFGVGPTKVVLGTINVTSEGNMGSKPYENFVNTCQNASFFTDIPINTASTLTVSIGNNSQRVTAWIDYNNNGVFESTELIGDSPSVAAFSSTSFTFTPPSAAITNSYLRLRIKSDANGDANPCGNLQYGQIEDFAVKIVASTVSPTLPVAPNGLPGQSVLINNTTSTGNYVNIPNITNVYNNAFVFSCWVKPSGIQTNGSTIFFTTNSSPMGLSFINGNNTIAIMPGNISTGFIAPANEWTHIAYVSNGATVKVYVNGREFSQNITSSGTLISEILLGKNGTIFSNLEVDEVSVWGRTLTIDDIRQYRHLTKSKPGQLILKNLAGYFQFNDTALSYGINNVVGGVPLIANFNGAGCSKIPSNAPVFEGIAEKKTITTVGSTTSFTTLGTAVRFKAGTSAPNGDFWIIKSTINPDVQPDANTALGFYTILNNYGTNNNLTIDYLRFYNNATINNTAIAASKYKLYSRSANGYNTGSWGAILNSASSLAAVSGSVNVYFSTGLLLNNMGQLVITQAP